MNEQQASRTLLKSPPELWAECSDAQSLSKHFGDSIGEIQITKLEPEHTVAWEGDRTSGTVKLEPSGWGTRVTLTCSTAAVEDVETEAAKTEPEPQAPEPEPRPAPREASTEPPADEPLRGARPDDPPRDVRPDEPPRNVRPDEPPRGRLFARMMRWFSPERPWVEPAAPVAEQPPPEPAAEQPPPEPAAEQPTPEPPASPEPARVSEASHAREPADASQPGEALAAALESLGQAHHRPFSRA